MFNLNVIRSDTENSSSEPTVSRRQLPPAIHAEVLAQLQEEPLPRLHRRLAQGQRRTTLTHAEHTASMLSRIWV